MTYRICWKSKLTGYQGHGSPMTEQNANQLLKYAKEKWGHICDHWLEPVK